MDDDGIVARLRQPLPLGSMEALLHALEAAYGNGLVVRGEGDWMIVLLPQGVAAPQ